MVLHGNIFFGADGMETAIDYSNQNTIYESYQYGALNRSLDGGSSWTYIAPSSGDWITPFIIDPIVNTRLYYGTNALYKSDNRGTSWTAVAGVNFNSGYGSAIAVAPSNNNIVYASLYQIFRADISNNTAKYYRHPPGLAVPVSIILLQVILIRINSGLPWLVIKKGIKCLVQQMAVPPGQM